MAKLNKTNILIYSFKVYRMNLLKFTNEILSKVEEGNNPCLVSTYGGKVGRYFRYKSLSEALLDIYNAMRKDGVKSSQITLSVEDGFINMVWYNTDGTERNRIEIRKLSPKGIEAISKSKANGRIVITSCGFIFKDYHFLKYKYNNLIQPVEEIYSKYEQD